MSLDALGTKALDYLACRYGDSKLLFRGPARDLTAPYIAFLGSTETYGKFVAEPFVDLLDAQLKPNCVNFGCLNAGTDVFLKDPFLHRASQDAVLTILQVPGVQNMTNRLYSVHPRRNDRFVSTSEAMQAVYPDVDFANFHFNKHMLRELKARSQERFEIIRHELRSAWQVRMETLINHLGGPTVLVWISARSPDDTVNAEMDPMLVTRPMLDKVAAQATKLVEVTLSEAAAAQTTEGMVFSPMEAPVARQVFGPLAHREIADRLQPVLKEML